MRSYRWDFTFIETYGPLFVRGFIGMAELAATIAVASLVIGFFIALTRLSKHRLPRIFGTLYVEFFRNIPSLVHLLWLFYALPILTQVQVKPFAAAAIGFSLYTAAYMAEIFRTGISSIEHGQWQAGRALGLTYTQQMRYIVLPQAVQRMLPAFTNQFTDVIKLTAVASLIAYPEIVYYAKQIAETEYRPIEAFTAAAVMFTIILVPLAYLALGVEHYFKRFQR